MQSLGAAKFRTSVKVRNDGEPPVQKRRGGSDQSISSTGTAVPIRRARVTRWLRGKLSAIQSPRPVDGTSPSAIAGKSHPSGSVGVAA